VISLLNRGEAATAAGSEASAGGQTAHRHIAKAAEKRRGEASMGFSWMRHLIPAPRWRKRIGRFRIRASGGRPPGIARSLARQHIERRRRSHAAGFQEEPVVMRKLESILIRNGESFGNADRAARPRLHAHADPFVI
jgi:hypothetical protein